MSTKSKSFSLLICPDAIKSKFLSVVSLKETIRPEIWSKSCPKIAKKSPLTVDVCRSETLLLIKLPAVYKDNKLDIPRWSSYQLTHTERDLSLLPIAQQEYCWTHKYKVSHTVLKTIMLVGQLTVTIIL